MLARDKIVKKVIKYNFFYYSLGYFFHIITVGMSHSFFIFQFQNSVITDFDNVNIVSE